MLKKEVAELINRQINREFYSSYFYLDIANFYENKSLKGFANWFRVQAQEERDHALLFVDYMHNSSETVHLYAIDAPNQTFPDFKEPLLATFAHEQFVTGSINEIYAEAMKQNDFRTQQFLNWFVNEQGEEEKNTQEIIDRYDLFGYDAKSLYLLDAELAARIYAPPTLTL